MSENNVNNTKEHADVLEYINEVIAAAGNLMMGVNGGVYYIDGVEIDHSSEQPLLVVICDGKKYTVSKDENSFYVNNLVKKSDNDSVFGQLIAM